MIRLQRARCGEVHKDRVVRFGQEDVTGLDDGALGGPEDEGVVAQQRMWLEREAGGEIGEACADQRRARGHAPFGHHAAARRFGCRLIVLAIPGEEQRRQY